MSTEEKKMEVEAIQEKKEETAILEDDDDDFEDFEMDGKIRQFIKIGMKMTSTIKLI